MFKILGSIDYQRASQSQKLIFFHNWNWSGGTLLPSSPSNHENLYKIDFDTVLRIKFKPNSFLQNWLVR